MPTSVSRVIVDTGPLVAWLDAADAHHAQVTAWLGRYQGQLISTWPVVTESCHLLPARMVADFLRWVGAGGLTVLELPAASVPGLADRMDKYADLPVDLADASPLWAAETLGVLDVLTLDRRDFGVYRTVRGKSLRNLLDLPRARRVSVKTKTLRKGA